MMKKIVVILGALLMVFSGVAAVSAYEAHIINVTAHVENALTVTTPGGLIHFGTVFPEEFINKYIIVSFSTSFSSDAQQRVQHLAYEVWVEQKPKPGGGYYPCLADALYIGIQSVVWTLGNPSPLPQPIDLRPTVVGGNLFPVGTCTLPKKVTNGTLSKVDVDPGTPGQQYENHDDYVYVVIDVPVFEGYYNADTDAIGCVLQNPLTPHKPNGLCKPTVIITKYLADGVTPNPRWDPGGTQNIILGADVKIQVTNIYQ